MVPRHFIALVAATGTLLAACDRTSAQPAPIASRAPDLDKIAGVYKHRFANSDVSGDRFTSENVFELVKLSPRTAYFRIHAEFYNGHLCALSGVADLEPDALTYRGPADLDGRPCVLKVTVNTAGVITNDVGGSCRTQSCGARGGYGDGAAVNYPFEARRPIRYLARILKSSQYASAVKEHDGRPAPSREP